MGACDATLLGGEGEPRALLARAGVDVYSMDYRTHFATEGHAEWGFGTLLADVLAAVHCVRSRHADRPLLLVGHSFGAKLAYLCAARLGDRLYGLVVLDGWLRDPPDSASQTSLDAAGPRPPAAGPPRPGRSRVLELAVAHLRRSIVAEPPGQAGRMTGSAATDAEIELVARCLLEGDRWWPSLAERQARALAAGLDVPGVGPVEAALKRITVPLLNIIAGERGEAFTRRALHTGRLADCASRTEVILPGWGHLDLVIGHHFGVRVCAEIVGWLNAVRGAAPR